VVGKSTYKVDEYVFLICAFAVYPKRSNKSPFESFIVTVVEKSDPWSIYILFYVYIYNNYKHYKYKQTDMEVVCV